MNFAQRALKRFQREHRPKIRIVERAPSEAEGQRRADKAASLVGTPFKHLPGNPPQDQIVFTTTDRTPVPVSAVEMVWNDAWLIDQCCGEGHYAKINAGRREAEVFAFAKRAYAQERIQ